MTEQIDIHALAGAYALNAVDDIERAAFDRHIRQCAACAAEVTEFRETTARLVDETTVEPPPKLRDSVLAAIARTPQERPRRADREPAAAPRWRRWTAAAAAAAVLAVGAGAATWAVADQRVREERALVARVESVLGAPDARLVSSVVAGGRVTLVVSASRDAAVAVLNGLASPGKNRAYQMWLVDDGGPASVGVMPEGAGSGTKYIDHVGDAQKFALSNEPESGSRTPTDVVGDVTITG